jgi:hypothetical protein
VETLEDDGRIVFETGRVKKFYLEIDFCYYYYYYYYYVSPPVLTFSYSLTLCCVCPYNNYFYVHCAVSVIGLVAVGSAHK